jgi:oxaloacetate decarboxylase alpha subunit/pyruvate carboxylase subunit B
MITGQVKDLCYGLYGKTAVPIDPEVQKKALKGYPRGEEPIFCRPAEVLAPELEKAKAEIGDLAADMDDLLIYAQFPVTGKKFLEWKYGRAEVPASVKPISMEFVKKQDELVKKRPLRRLLPRRRPRPRPLTRLARVCWHRCREWSSST